MRATLEGWAAAFENMLVEVRRITDVGIEIKGLLKGNGKGQADGNGAPPEGGGKAEGKGAPPEGKGKAEGRGVGGKGKGKAEGKRAPPEGKGKAPEGKGNGKADPEL